MVYCQVKDSVVYQNGGSHRFVRMTYYDNGQVRDSTTFEHFRHLGPDVVIIKGGYKKYYENGNPKEYRFYTSDSTFVDYIYYESGVLNSEAPYENRDIHGKSIVYYPSGLKKYVTTYKHRKIDGDFEAYYENGNIKEKVLFRDSAENGPFTTYHENGQVHKRGRFIGGVEYDTLRIYDLQGKFKMLKFCRFGHCDSISSKGYIDEEE